MSRRIRLSVVVVVLTLALAALGVTSCGGASSNSSVDAAALIKDTFGSNHPMRSGRLDAALDVDLRGLARLNGPLSLHLTGPFQSRGGKTLPDFAFDLDLQSGPRPITLGAVFAGGGGWLTIEGQAFTLGRNVTDAFTQGYMKAKADAARKSGSAPSLAALGISPQRWLRNPQTKGTEDIAGQATEHVAAQVDVGRLLDDVSTLLGKARSVTSAGGAATGTQVPTQLTPQQRQEIERSVKSASVDVWTGTDDHTLRKVALDVVVDVPQELRARAGGLRGGHIALQVTIADLNKAQQVVKPASARPLSELQAVLRQTGVLGGSGSGSGSASGSGSGSGSASAAGNGSASDPQAGYTSCLTKAGEDLAKVQRCAALLK